MSTFLLLSILFITSFGGKAFSKLCSDAVVGHSKDRYAVFMAVNGAVASVFFFISGGFRVEVNLPTLAYAAVYALIVVLSLISNMVALKYMNIVTLTVVTGTLGLIATSATGAWLFDEIIDTEKILRVAIMVAAVVLFALDGKMGKKGKKEKSVSPAFSLKAVTVILVMLTVNCASTVITKYYAIDTRVCDANSCFFFTNVILVGGGLLLVAADLIKNSSGLKDIAPLFKPLNFLSLSGNTVCSNVGSLVGILIISKMDVSVYAPVSSAIGILAGFLGSLVFRQKMGWLSYIGALGAVVAVII